ncbi:hypothetical protein D3C72_1778440 [compost metagenome]
MAHRQMLGPLQHFRRDLRSIVRNHMDGRGIDAQHELDALGTERIVFGHNIIKGIFEVGQALRHRLDALAGNFMGLSQKRTGNDVHQGFDDFILPFIQNPSQRQPLTQYGLQHG